MTDWEKRTQRIDRLLASWPELTHTFGFATGALCALKGAADRGMRDRRSYAEGERAAHTQVVRDVLVALQSGHAPAQDWIAGFLYNSSLMRIAACYERFLRAVRQELKRRRPLPPLVTHGPDGVTLSKTEAWARQIEQALEGTVSLHRSHLEQIREDVNRLKHGLFGRVAEKEHTRSIGDIEGAIAGFDELLTILETSGIQQSLREAYRGLPPA